MPRYKLTIEYDGGPFVGWQKQENGPTIQAALERAAEAFDGGPREVYGAGRTDAGVHALAMTAHVDLEKPLRTDVVRDAFNHHLRPLPIAVLNAERVDDSFHARFGATLRGYLYRIADRRPPLTLDRGHVWRIPRKLDAERMHEAAQVFVGTHDFTTFRDVQCQAETPIKSLDRISVSRRGPEIHVEVEAISFLHRQVRSIVGSLAEVGCGKWTGADLQDALDARDRRRCGPVAPSDGLYLDFVRYDSVR